MTPEALRDFDRWAAKAPVRREGPQRTAARLWPAVRDALTESERRELGSALGHALDVGLGRGEFDRVVASVRERLVGE